MRCRVFVVSTMILYTDTATHTIRNDIMIDSEAEAVQCFVPATNAPVSPYTVANCCVDFDGILTQKFPRLSSSIKIETASAAGKPSQNILKASRFRLIFCRYFL